MPMSSLEIAELMRDNHARRLVPAGLSRRPATA
jgi:hypothetical protein